MTSTPGYIYFLHATGSPRYKIGRAKWGRLKARIQELDGGQASFPIALVGWIAVTDIESAEKQLHETFHEIRIVKPNTGRFTEWFDFSGNDETTIINTIAREYAKTSLNFGGNIDFLNYEDFGNLEEHPVFLSQFNYWVEQWQPIREPEPTYSNYSGYSTPSYSYSDDFPWGWIVGIGAVALIGFGAITQQGSMQSRQGEDRKVTQTEVSRYAQAGRTINNGGNPAEIAKHFQVIASATQVTCIKSFATEMRDKAESQLDMRRELWEVRQRYLNGGCEPIKVLDNLSGYLPQKPQESVAESPKPKQSQSSKIEPITGSRTAIVKNNRSGENAAHLRQVPNGKSVGEVLNGTKVEILEVGDGWTRIRAKVKGGDEVTGWVYSEFIK